MRGDNNYTVATLHIWWQRKGIQLFFYSNILLLMASANFTAPLLCSSPKCEDWKLFKRPFQNYLAIISVADDAKKLPHLLNAVGRDGYIIYDGLKDPKTSYDEVIERFDEFFKVRSSLLLRRKQFFEAKQEINETIVEYSCRLRRLIAECDFSEDIRLTLLKDIVRVEHAHYS